MSDDRELSPEQQRVRDLLAEARVDAPVPGDVVDRLDRVLASLAEEDGEARSSVVDLASRRRRKASKLLVAAAAAVAVGVGVGTLAPDSLGGSDDATSAAESEPAPAADGPGQEDADLSAGSAAASAAPRLLVSGRPARVRPDHFAADVARLDVSQTAAYSAESAPAPEDDQSRVLRNAAAMCDPAPWGPGRLVAVRYAGAPAVLAYRPPAGESRVVDLLECGTAAILRSVTLPAP